MGLKVLTSPHGPGPTVNVFDGPEWLLTIWVSRDEPDKMFLDRPGWRRADEYGDGGGVRLAVPDWFRRSFDAGEPVLPLLDWLAEHHGEGQPWVAELVGRVARAAQGGRHG